MKFSILALPVLATAVVVQRQAARDVQVVSAKSISEGQGSGCPTRAFGVQPNLGNNTLTLSLDIFYTALDYQDLSDTSNRFCDYEVTLRFPSGCTTGTVFVQPRGSILLDERFEAKYLANYVFSPSTGTETKSPGETVYKSSNYGAPVGTWTDFTIDHPVDVKVNAANGQNDFIFRVTNRIFLVNPGISQDESGLFAIDSINIGVRNMVSC